MKLSGPGVSLILRLQGLQNEPQRSRTRWRWMLDWWDNRRRARRRGVPVA